MYLVRSLDRVCVEERAGGHEQDFRFQSVGGSAGEASVVVVRIFRRQQRCGLVAQADDVFHAIAELRTGDVDVARQVENVVHDRDAAVTLDELIVHQRFIEQRFSQILVLFALGQAHGEVDVAQDDVGFADAGVGLCPAGVGVAARCGVHRGTGVGVDARTGPERAVYGQVRGTVEQGAADAVELDTGVEIDVQVVDEHFQTQAVLESLFGRHLFQRNVIQIAGPECRKRCYGGYDEFFHGLRSECLYRCSTISGWGSRFRSLHPRGRWSACRTR